MKHMAIIKLRRFIRHTLAPVARRSAALARDDRGAVAIEFGILAIPFFALIFAILETAMVFFAQQILESALQDSIRDIRTGQSQAGTPWTTTEFRTEICDHSFGFFNCTGPGADRLWIKVTPVNSFGVAPNQIQNPVNPSCTMASPDPATQCNWIGPETFNDGSGSSVIIAQAYYRWPTIINVPWFSFANQAGNNRLLGAVRVFKNEPFGSGGTSGSGS
jgi:Flp pilus assembly protein TadG